MKVKTISYAKVFPLAAYVNEKIGVEIELDGLDGYEETFSKAKQLVEKFHKDNNPQIVEGGVMQRPNLGHEEPSYQTFPPIFPQPIPTVDRKATERLEILIDDAKSIIELDGLYADYIRHGLLQQYRIKRESLQK